MNTATMAPTNDVGLDPTGIRRLTAAARHRATTRAAVHEAVAHEIDILRKRRYRAVEALELIDREIEHLKQWQEREKGERQC